MLVRRLSEPHPSPLHGRRIHTQYILNPSHPPDLSGPPHFQDLLPFGLFYQRLSYHPLVLFYHPLPLVLFYQREPIKSSTQPTHPPPRPLHTAIANDATHPIPYSIRLSIPMPIPIPIAILNACACCCKPSNSRSLPPSLPLSLDPTLPLPLALTHSDTTKGLLRRRAHKVTLPAGSTKTPEGALAASELGG